ncbi:hypothetical protein [Pantoea sp. GD03673]|uniref:hypothetical protein n=1 Tax=Pantoea sp. GD03673 TaxID=2975364 RepID=UPI00244C50E9|nr:hypothetical protein [Pantoea sp. GD03673]MDH2069657.1 hypothetical protein [Pantoea sp. GD03673]
MNSLSAKNSWNYTPSFPLKKKDEIERSSIVETIFEILNDDTNVVFLEGESGIGATTLLAQLVRNTCHLTFSIFLNPSSKYSYSVEYVKVLLAEQFRSYLGEPEQGKLAIEEAEYLILIHKVRVSAKKDTIFIVVDGLNHIPTDDESDINDILRIALPVGVAQYKFIISGSQRRLAKHINNVNTKPYQIMKLSASEVDVIFKDVNLSEKELGEIKDVCKGVPGHLSSIKRMIMDGTTLESILKNTPEKYLDFVDIEIKKTLLNDEEFVKLIAIIAYSKQEVCVEDLATLSSLPAIKIIPFLEKQSFIKIRDGSFINFISSSHRKVAERNLKDYQSEINDLQIQLLSSDPNSKTALLFLPSYLQQKNRYEELIELLSKDHYYKLLDSTQSLSQLMTRAELGLASAHTLKKATAVFQFSLQKSLFIDLAKSTASEEEIRALVSIGDSNHAMEIINSAITKTSKLILLTSYACGLKRKGREVDEVIIQSIKELVKNVDFDKLGDIALQVVENIMAFDPELAANVLECSFDEKQNPQKDFAYSRATIAAAMGVNETGNPGFDKKIKSKALQEFTSALVLFQKEKNSEQIIEFIDSSASEHKISLLLSFIKVSLYSKNLQSLIEYALKLIVEDTGYFPKAKDYAELAEALRGQDINISELKKIIAKFDSQITLLKNKSVTRDWTRLSCAISCSESKFDKKKAFERIIEIYYDLSEISNHEIKAECYARIIYALKIVDSDGDFEKEEKIRELITAELQTSIEELIKNTVSQYECIEHILPAIAEYDVENAIILSSKLNTSSNRELAYKKLVQIVISKEFTEKNKFYALQILNKLNTNDLLSMTLLALSKKITKLKIDCRWIDFLSLQAGRVKDPVIKLGIKINLFKYYNDKEEVRDHKEITDLLYNVLENVSVSNTRNNMCFIAVEVLSKFHPLESKKAYKEIISTRNSLEFEKNEVQESFFRCLALVIRSLHPLMRETMLDENLLFRLTSSIEKMVSIRHQIALFCELATRYWIAGGNPQKIIDNFCIPILETIKKKDPIEYTILLEIAFPAIYVYRQTSALSRLSDLDDDFVDSALYQTCELIRRKQTKYDPDIVDDSESFIVSHHDCEDILNLINNMNDDSVIYLVIDKLTRTVASKKNKSRLTHLQRKDLSDKLISVIDDKLPDQKNITHDGFLICAYAKAYSITDVSQDKWIALISKIDNIPNIADKAFVQIEVSKCLPTKMIVGRDELLDNAQHNIDLIPSVKDRIGRNQTFSLACKNINTKQAKNILKQTFELSKELNDDEDISKIQSSLIDSADQIEPGYADVLLELFDDDPARREAKMNATHNVEVIRAKKKLAEHKTLDTDGVIDQSYISEASWKNFSSLLAHRISAKNLDVMISYMTIDSELGLSEIYPLYCWYIENSARKFKSKNDIKTQIQPVCEMLLTSTEMAFAIVNRKNDFISKSSIEVSDSSFIVHADNRDQALNFISDWLQKNGKDYIKICDPYFSKNDIDIISLFSELEIVHVIHVLTRLDYLKSKSSDSNESFESEWHSISDQSPPETYIYGIEKTDGHDHIHDRWLITKGNGLRIGTSFNSLGNKMSEISVMTSDDAEKCEAELDRYLNGQVMHNGKRVRKTVFQL